MEKLIITAAITGAELTKDHIAALPTTCQEQASDAKACLEAGASIIHLHVRDEKAKPSQELSHFEKAVDAIQKACQQKAILQFSTGGAVGEDMQKRIAPLTLKPHMASFNTGSINFGDDVFINTFPEMRELARAMQKNHVVPEFELYDLGHMANLKKLIKEDIIEPPFHLQFVLGVPGALQGDTFADLAPLVQSMPENSSWGVAGIGRFELPLATVAIATGGHVRVGLEDNIYFSKGVKATSNAQLVERIVRIAKAYGRDIATPDEAKRILGIKN